MTAKQFKIARIAVSMSIAGIVSFAATTGNYALSLAVVVVGILAMFAMKKQVKEITHDERDLANAGRAARYAILAYGLTAAAISIPLFAMREQNPNFEAAASALAYSACALMLLQGIIFQIVAGKFNLKNKRVVVMIVAVSILAAMLTVRFFSGENDYICQNGQWQKHGQPDFPVPTEPCK